MALGGGARRQPVDVDSERVSRCHRGRVRFLLPSGGNLVPAPASLLARPGRAHAGLRLGRRPGRHPVQALISMVIPNYWHIFQFGEVPYKLPWNPTFLYLYFGLLGLAFALV